VTYLCFDFDPGLQQTGTDKIVGHITLDNAQKLNGSLSLTNYDLSGGEVFSACCATIAGARLPLERLPADADKH
jgi:hypothetical protein